MPSPKTRNLRASIMWMTRKFMIMITRTKTRLTGRILTGHNQELLNTTVRTVTVIKINTTDGMGKSIIRTAMLKVTTTTTALRTTTMICGDCNVDGATDFSCSHAYTMEYSALFISGWMESSMVGLSVFGKVIVGKHSVWWSQTFHKDALG